MLETKGIAGRFLGLLVTLIMVFGGLTVLGAATADGPEETTELDFPEIGLTETKIEGRLGGGEFTGIYNKDRDAMIGVLYGTSENPNNVYLVSLYTRYLGTADVYENGILRYKDKPIPVRTLFAQRFGDIYEFDDESGDGMFDSSMATESFQIKEKGYGAHSLTSDPLFVDPRNGNFKLLSTSPARNAASDGKDLGVDLSTLCSVSKKIATDSVIYVNGSDPNANDHNNGTMSSPLKTIQAGVDRAKAGDTVYVMAGTYREVVQINKSGTYSSHITISAYPGDKVIINSTGYACFNLVMSKHVTINGFELTNAYGNSQVAHGGGIRCFPPLNTTEDVANVTGDIYGAKSCIFSNNTVHDNDAGIWLTVGHDNIVENNVVWGSREAPIRVKHSNNNVVRSNLCYMNGKMENWGICYYGATGTQVYHNTVYEPRGGTVYIYEGTSNLNGAKPGSSEFCVPCNNSEVYDNIGVVLDGGGTGTHFGAPMVIGSSTTTDRDPILERLYGPLNNKYHHNLWYNPAAPNATVSWGDNIEDTQEYLPLVANENSTSREGVFKKVSTSTSWQRSEVQEIATGNGTKEWTFSLTAKDLAYKGPFGALKADRTDKLEYLNLTFHLYVDAKTVTRDDVPVWRVDVSPKGDGDYNVVGSKSLGNRSYSGQAVSASFKYDSGIYGWDFAERNGAPCLLWVTQLLLANAVSDEVAGWMGGRFLEQGRGSGSMRYDDSELKSDDAKDGSDLEDGADDGIFSSRRPDLIRKNTLSCADDWQKVGCLTWVNDVSVDGVKERMYFQIYGAKRFVRVDWSKGAAAGFMAMGGFSYPGGKRIFHDPTYTSDVFQISGETTHADGGSGGPGYMVLGLGLGIAVMAVVAVAVLVRRKGERSK